MSAQSRPASARQAAVPSMDRFEALFNVLTMAALQRLQATSAVLASARLRLAAGGSGAQLAAGGSDSARRRLRIGDGGRASLAGGSSRSSGSSSSTAVGANSSVALLPTDLASLLWSMARRPEPPQPLLREAWPLVLQSLEHMNGPALVKTALAYCSAYLHLRGQRERWLAGLDPELDPKSGLDPGAGPQPGMLRGQRPEPQGRLQWQGGVNESLTAWGGQCKQQNHPGKLVPASMRAGGGTSLSPPRSRPATPPLPRPRPAKLHPPGHGPGESFYDGMLALRALEAVAGEVASRLSRAALGHADGSSGSSSAGRQPGIPLPHPMAAAARRRGGGGEGLTMRQVSVLAACCAQAGLRSQPLLLAVRQLLAVAPQTGATPELSDKWDIAGAHLPSGGNGAYRGCNSGNMDKEMMLGSEGASGAGSGVRAWAYDWPAADLRQLLATLIGIQPGPGAGGVAWESAGVDVGGVGVREDAGP